MVFLNSKYDKARDSVVLSFDVTQVLVTLRRECRANGFFSETNRGVRIELIQLIHNQTDHTNTTHTYVD